MSRTTQTDGGDEATHKDERVAGVETVRIHWEDFKTALRNDHLTDTDRQRGGHTVLRLRAPFDGTVEAETHFSEQGRHYSRDVDPKPIHVRPHFIVEDGRDDGWRFIGDYPTESTTRHALREEEIEEAGGIEAVVEESRELWWDELRHSLPDSFNLGAVVSPEHKRVEIEWVFDEGEEQ